MTHTAPTLTSKIARRLGFALALAAFVAAMVAPAAGMAAAPVKFGSKLNPTVQPSNGSPGIQCEPGTLTPCTMVQNEAYGRPDGGEFAPKTGTIKRIRIIAADAGSFRPQIATVKHTTSTTLGDTKAKVTYTGPKLSFSGQTEANEESGRYKVETFAVNIPVKKGQQLALRGNVASMVRCSSGGHNTLLFTPALGKGGSFQGATDSNGCWILMEAVIR
ncbi:MAG: hypothetical protein QOE75_72 [Solirubrobacterales bacterium]|jgi:hypothetical protein|nr:hypothetical protein [Solirubrobacterales bacterium]